jgi:hypothetical protein
MNAISRGGVLHQRDYRLLWFGETARTLGNSVTAVSLPLIAVVERDVLEGNSTLRASEAATSVAGPGLAGLRTHVLGAVGGLLVNVLTFPVSTLCLTSIRAKEDPLRPSSAETPHSSSPAPSSPRGEAGRAARGAGRNSGRACRCGAARTGRAGRRLVADVEAAHAQSADGRWFAASRPAPTGRASPLAPGSGTRCSRGHPAAASKNAFAPFPVGCGAHPCAAPDASPAVRSRAVRRCRESARTPRPGAPGEAGREAPRFLPARRRPPGTGVRRRWPRRGGLRRRPS